VALLSATARSTAEANLSQVRRHFNFDKHEWSWDLLHLGPGTCISIIKILSAQSWTDCMLVGRWPLAPQNCGALRRATFSNLFTRQTLQIQGTKRTQRTQHQCTLHPAPSTSAGALAVKSASQARSLKLWPRIRMHVSTKFRTICLYSWTPLTLMKQDVEIIT
jgi:hypothetical protein